MSSAFAYIPELKTILSRTAENHGRGIYSVNQDVVFSGAAEPMVVRETWLIRDENSMRVTLEGKGPLKGQIQGTIVYEGTQRYWIDEGATTPKRKRIPDEWAEPAFHFRASKPFRARLVNLKVIPESLSRERAPFVRGAASYIPQPDLRLSRVGGVVAYAIGVPASGQSSPAGLWIEQDNFLVRKLRFPSSATVLADQFQQIDQNLWLPKTRTINWGGNAVQIQLADVHAQGKNNPNASRFLQPQSLVGQAQPLKIPEVSTIQEFYARFR